MLLPPNWFSLAQSALSIFTYPHGPFGLASGSLRTTLIGVVLSVVLETLGSTRAFLSSTG